MQIIKWFEALEVAAGVITIFFKFVSVKHNGVQPTRSADQDVRSTQLD